MPNDRVELQKMQRSFTTRLECVKYLKDTPEIINDIQNMRPTNTGMRFRCLDTNEVEVLKRKRLEI
jgi:hypothetical protein